MIDQIFADSIRQAIKDFGPDIISQKRLIGIIKDYRGFRTLPPAEPITRMLIETGTMARLEAVSGKSEKDISEFVLRTVATSEQQYGFAEKYLKTTILSILAGMGIKLKNMDVPDKSHSAQPSVQTKSTRRIEVVKDEREYKPTTIEHRGTPQRPPSQNQGNVRAKGKLTATNNPQTGSTQIGNKGFLISLLCCIIMVVISFVCVKISDNYHHAKELLGTRPYDVCPDTTYMKILHGIQHSGESTTQDSLTKVEFERAMKDYPYDYWLNIIKEKCYEEKK